MDYRGPDRRIHKVFVTKNTEYHVCKNVCVAVRDRRTGRWIEGHMALSRALEGSLQYTPHGVVPNPGQPAIGDAVYFRTGERDLITSRLQSIDRPERTIIAQYPAR